MPKREVGAVGGCGAPPPPPCPHLTSALPRPLTPGPGRPRSAGKASSAGRRLPAHKMAAPARPAGILLKGTRPSHSVPKGVTTTNVAAAASGGHLG